MQTDVHKPAYLVYTTNKMPNFTATLTKMRFVGRNSQPGILYDNLHNRLYTDFEIRVIIFKETLPWSLKKAARHGLTLFYVANEPLKIYLTLFYVASELLKICGHNIVAYRRTIPLQVSRPTFAGKGTDVSELYPYHCITPELLTSILSSVSVIPPCKLLLHELIQLIGIKLLTYSFLDIFAS